MQVKDVSDLEAPVCTQYWTVEAVAALMDQRARVSCQWWKSCFIASWLGL